VRGQAQHPHVTPGASHSLGCDAHGRDDGAPGSIGSRVPLCSSAGTPSVHYMCGADTQVEEGLGPLPIAPMGT
jgi:hypothetical protein